MPVLGPFRAHIGPAVDRYKGLGVPSRGPGGPVGKGTRWVG